MGIATFRLAREREAAKLKVASPLLEQKKVKKPKIIEKGNFGEDGWSISIGDVEDGDS